MTAIEEAIDLLEKAKKALHYQSTGYDYINQALAKLREAEPTELTKWLRKAIASERYEKGDKKLQTKVRKACELIEEAEGRTDIQTEVGSWAEKQFNKSTNSSICEHLRREAKELRDSFKPSEAADCFLILLHFAYKNNFDIVSEALKKHAINKNRKWGEPDEQGVCEHIEAAQIDKQAKTIDGS